ncbi:hypothetical protein [Carboxylicivirga marina]|uniref:hypothetical protein n=1 Tax=Carboxylicivirga marina TaxID=2800988 RepID=UPI002592C2BE|nr:hypothetical protein [uncultured Carboxylicivirga sp.]
MKQPRKPYQLADMESGDRFYFATDKKQTVWQVTLDLPGKKVIAKPGKSENRTKFDTSVVFLRNVI